MRTAPADIDDTTIAGALARYWGVEAVGVGYSPVGFGSHHWTATDPAGRRIFVNVDDLGSKARLGLDADVVYSRLAEALTTARDLRQVVGLRFLAAPLPCTAGEPLVRINPVYAMSVFPFVVGEPGEWGDILEPADRSLLIGALARLHDPSVAETVAPAPAPTDVPGRAELEVTLENLGRVWTGGPYSERAHGLVAANLSDLQRLLTRLDSLAPSPLISGHSWVTTHGEPHPGKVIRSPDGLVLIDWDTVGLAPAERDLWILSLDDAETALYEGLTGRSVDRRLLSFYSLRWDVADLAGGVALLRSAHSDTADTRTEWHGLQSIVTRAATGQL